MLGKLNTDINATVRRLLLFGSADERGIRPPVGHAFDQQVSPACDVSSVSVYVDQVINKHVYQ